jgi:hypothetical protein
VDSGRIARRAESDAAGRSVAGAPPVTDQEFEAALGGLGFLSGTAAVKWRMAKPARLAEHFAFAR